MRKSNTLSFDRLNEVFNADFENGILTWKSAPSYRTKIGTVAGNKRPTGHLFVQVDGKAFAVHRLIWAMFHNEWPHEMIDHINQNPEDNRISNLRSANKSQNGMNRGVQSNNKLGVKGVSIHRKTGKYRASIKVKSKFLHLGLYEKIEDAQKSYADAAKQHFGEFSPV